jgi:hypothetical protein
MVGFATVIAIGIVIGSISVSMIIFWESQTTSKFSEYGDVVKVGDVEFDVQYVTNHEILKKNKMYAEFEKLYVKKGLIDESNEIPEGVYFQIQITANNMSNETIENTLPQEFRLIHQSSPFLRIISQTLHTFYFF